MLPHPQCFVSAPETPPGFWRRKFGGGNEDGAYQAVVNRILANGVDRIRAADLDEIGQKYAVGALAMERVVERVYQAAVLAHIATDGIGPDEGEYLDRLGRNLGLTEATMRATVQEALRPQFRALADELVASRAQAGTAVRRVDELRQQHSLSHEAAADLYAEAAQGAVAAFIESALADGRVTDDEALGLAQLGTWLGMPLELGGKAKETLNRARLLWKIENGELPDVPADIALQRGERCHFMAPAAWHELRTRTVRVDYGGPIGTIRIAKGIRFRVGSIIPNRVTRTELEEILAGMLYITNKRVIVRGDLATKSVTLRSLVGAKAFADGCQLEKATGKSPYILIKGDVELALVVLSAVLN